MMEIKNLFISTKMGFTIDKQITYLDEELPQHEISPEIGIPQTRNFNQQ